MPSDPPTPAAEWHAELAVHDTAAHELMAAVARETEPALLRRRLDAVGAELTVLRAAVDLRSRLLHEQAVALRERDAQIEQLTVLLAEASSLTPRRVVRKVRSVAGRVVRTGLRQG